MNANLRMITGSMYFRLEVRGQKAFNMFMESLREHYRHLHSVLDESVRNIDSMEHDDTELERVLLSGDAVSKLIKRAHADTASNLVRTAN